MYSIADAINNDKKIILFDSRKHRKYLGKLYNNDVDYIEIKQNGRFIQMNKKGDENKRYELDLKTETYHRYYKNKNGDKKGRKIKSKSLEKWFKNSIIYTYDYRLAKLIIFNINHSNKRVTNFIRFIEALNNEACQSIEQWLGIVDIEDINRILKCYLNTGFKHGDDELSSIYYQVVEIDKEKLNYIKKQKQISIDELNWICDHPLKYTKFIKKFEKTVEEEDIFEDLHGFVRGHRINTIADIIWTYNLDIDRFVEYIKYLKEYEYTDLNWVALNYEDYLRAEYILRGQKYSKMTKYPKNLIQAHHNKTAIIKEIEQERMRLAKEEQKEKDRQLYINHKYLEYQDSKYSIIVPNEAEDVIAEGNNLNHCVGSYIGRISRGETFIVFMRKTDNIDESFITVEIKNNTIRTALGLRNRTISKDEKDFLKHYAEIKRLKVDYLL